MARDCVVKRARGKTYSEQARSAGAAAHEDRMKLRRLPPLTLFLALSWALIAACSSIDPGAFEIVPRKDATPNPTPPGPPPPPGDGGAPGDGGDAGSASVVFDKPYAPGMGATDLIGTKHPNNGGPTSITAARSVSCTSSGMCHGAGAKVVYLAGGVASKANIEIGIRLSNGTVRTARSAAEGYFTIPFITGDTLVGSRTSARDGTRESVMLAAPTAGCNEGACHGGPQGVVFK